MKDGEDKPKLRWPLDLQPLEHQGERLVVIRDRSGISEQSAVVPAALMSIVSNFDGNQTLNQIANGLARYGVTLDMLRRIAADLDSYYLLENDRSRARWAEICRAYADLPIRPAAFAGGVYAADTSELKRELDGYISRAERPSAERIARAGKMVAMTSPHIDYRRGWHAYATGAAALEKCPEPEIIFLIGTSHQASRGIFHLTRKGFETPLGRLESAPDVIEDLSKLFGQSRSFNEEILHRSEHSLELQVPFLQRRFNGAGGKKAPLVVPILVGSFHSYLVQRKYPDEHGEARDFIGAWTEILKNLQASGRKVLVFGGIDLAHVGQHFGDSERVSDSKLPHIESRDKELLDAVLAADERRLFDHIAEDLDARRICGFPTMFTMLSALKRSGTNLVGDLIEYRQAADPTNDCVVTFASAYWSGV